MYVTLEQQKARKAEVVEPGPEEIRVETPEENMLRQQAERQRDAIVGQKRVDLMKYVGQQGLAWRAGLHIFDVNAKGRFDGVAPEILGEVGKGVLGYVKAILQDAAKASGLDTNVKLIERAADTIPKAGLNPLGPLTEGAPLVGTALSATKAIGSKLEAVHQQHFDALRAASIADLVHVLVIAGNRSLEIWQQLIEQADLETIEHMAERLDMTKPIFYGADVASLCERLLFQEMAKLQTARETIQHMRNLPRFIAEDTANGLRLYGSNFAPPKERR
jgi:hypothetical protein